MKSSELNDYYLSIYKSDLTELPNRNIINYMAEFKFDPIIPIDIINVIKNIKSNAIGHDQIAIRFIRIILNNVLEQLVHLFNYSLKNSVIPVR